MQSINSTETYAHGMSKDLICNNNNKKKKTYQYYKTIQTMINFDDVVKENIKEHNPN